MFLSLSNVSIFLFNQFSFESLCGARYRGVKPERYDARALAGLAAGALGVKKWRPRMAGQRGVRILALDGGGTRGVLTVSVLQQISRSTTHTPDDDDDDLRKTEEN